MILLYDINVTGFQILIKSVFIAIIMVMGGEDLIIYTLQCYMNNYLKKKKKGINSRQCPFFAIFKKKTALIMGR